MGKPPSTPKFIGTTVVNVLAVLAKDAQFARLFGTNKHAVPLMTYALFFARDAVTIYSSFVQPPQLAARLLTSRLAGRLFSDEASLFFLLPAFACPGGGTR